MVFCYGSLCSLIHKRNINFLFLDLDMAVWKGDDWNFHSYLDFMKEQAQGPGLTGWGYQLERKNLSLGWFHKLLHKPNLPLPTYPSCHLVGFLPAHIPIDRASMMVTETPMMGRCGRSHRDCFHTHKGLWSGTAWIIIFTAGKFFSI